MDNKLSLYIEYCGGWGYKPQFNSLANLVKQSFQDVTVEGKSIGGGTGCFEVYVSIAGKERQLLWSKLGG